MAYSRWNTSTWYTYWSSIHSGKTKEDQALQVEGEMVLTYSSIKNDRQSCLDAVNVLGDYAFEQMQELSQYMDEFCAEVDRKFG